uniref:B box-type domain-containing protein n=1 Tax=Magallana gigas TaxID=29159 RepID=A0A8W8LW52_MAGGI
MDPRSSAQDVHRCDLCETAIVHSYCDFCHVNLCKPCVVDHISDGYHKHTIVPFNERRSTLIYPKCGRHPHQHCELLCKDCRSFVCSSCMASEQHTGHRFVEVKHEFETKKEIIKKDKVELGNSISPKYEEIAFELENQLANLDEGYEKLTTEISKQGEEWHRQIDIVINKMKTEINGIKLKHKSILKKHLDEIKQIQSLIKETLIVLGELEKSTEISTAIEYISKIKTFSKLPPRVNVLLPTFIPKPIDHEHLYNFFGQIIPLCNAMQEHVLSINQPKTSVRELLDKPEVVATAQTGYLYLYSVTCLNEEIFWTTAGFSGDITCFNIKGNLLRTIKRNFNGRPNDIAADGDGDLLYTNWERKTVNKVRNEQTELLIKLQGWTPRNLCVTSTGDLLVTMYSDDKTQSKVVRYSGFTEKQTIQFDDVGKPLYSGNGSMKFITENRNNDICVADYKAGAVVVVNEAGKLRWRYTGHLSTTKNKSFKPQGVTSDSQCRILTADGENHCIHILNQDGQFLRYIDNCDFKDPLGVCVDSNDNLFVCDYGNSNVRKIRYSKDI